MAGPKQPAKTGSRGRTTVIAALLAVAVVVAVWLSNCIPGFGIGSSGDSEDAAKGGDAERADAAKREPVESTKSAPEKPEPKKPEPETPEPETPEPPKLGSAGTTLTVKIDVAGCAVAGSEPIECSKMCERTELFAGIDDAVLEVAGASHGSVVEMLDCLKAKGIDKVAVRRE
jgi:hypothetical protein